MLIKTIKHIHIVDKRDKWIIQKMGDELKKLSDKQIKFTFSTTQNPKADIHYYINWTSIVPPLYQLKKTKCDIIFFTHFETRLANVQHEKKVMDWTDKLLVMTNHGKEEIIKAGIKKPFGIINFFGTSITNYKKITLGWAGRPYRTLVRKNLNEYIQLAKDLNPKVFRFAIFNNNIYDKATEWFIKTLKKNGADVLVIKKDDYEHFIASIDYYLCLSTMEGGAMDILNAFKAGIPVCARNIGFFHSIRTKDDYLIENYEGLLKYFKKIERAKLQKMKVIEPYTWDNFRKQHIKYFRKELGL